MQHGFPLIAGKLVRGDADRCINWGCVCDRIFIPLFIQCDRSDVSVVPQVKSVHNEKPTLFIYDSYPGGIGLSEKVYDILVPILE